MLAFLIRRVIIAIPVLLGILALTFILVHMLPGDPATALLTPEELQGDPGIIERRRAELGLDRSMPVQYVAWLGELMNGNLGVSFHRKIPVTDMIAPRVMPTMILSGSGIVIALLVGVPVGIAAALRQNTKLDYAAGVGSMLAVSIPTFFQGLMAIYVFSIWLGWLPSGGMRTLGVPPTGLDLIRHLILPAGVLSAVLMGPYVRYTRQSLLDVLRLDHVTTARAKGVPYWGVVVKHALRNSLIPLTTVLAVQIPALLAGTVIIEYVFSWPGMGRLVIEGINSRDYPVILAVVMITAVLVLAFNFLADVIAAILDPRIRL
ncbi:MAG TPA: ABC transporter permease [Acidimicrobiia bacterium]|nr:ABC transporter permease [Acidimicrobiia bacterium]